MKPEIFRDLLERYHRGSCSDEEKELIENWYQRLPVDDQHASDETGEQIWAAISDKHNLAKKHSGNLIFKVAAAVVLFVLFGSVLYLSSRSGLADNLAEQTTIPAPPSMTSHNEVHNTSTIPQQIALEDGSTIILQPGGRITYPASFDAESRTVSLSGEAFFSISRDEQRPFYVFTREVVTKVLGTSFTVKADEDQSEITVAVKTGKVRVFTNPTDNEKPGTSVILTPNQQVVYNRKAVEISKQLVEKPEIILENPTLFEMKYDGAPVTHMFRVLEENYGVEIEYDDTVWSDCILTTSMSQEGLLERIEVITKAIGATYTVDDAVIRIRGNGCN